VTKELGIHVHTLYKWTSQFKKHKENAFPGSGNLRTDDAELKQLKKMVAETRQAHPFFCFSKQFSWISTNP
jgi:transposase